MARSHHSESSRPVRRSSDVRSALLAGLGFTAILCGLIPGLRPGTRLSIVLVGAALLLVGALLRNVAQPVVVSCGGCGEVIPEGSGTCPRCGPSS